jgi:hypothetical protein
VLAYVGDDDGLFEAAGGLGFAPDVVDDVRGVEMAVVGEVDDVADGGGAFAGVDLGEPGAGCWLLVAGLRPMLGALLRSRLRSLGRGREMQIPAG